MSGWEGSLVVEPPPCLELVSARRFDSGPSRQISAFWGYQFSSGNLDMYMPGLKVQGNWHL